MSLPSIRNSAKSGPATAPNTAVIPQPVSGNFLVLFVFDNTQRSTTAGLSDSAGNTWSAVLQAQDGNSNWVNLFTAPVTATGAGNDTVTMTSGGALHFIEVQGNKSSTPINDTAKSGTFSGSLGGTLTAGTINTTDANCLLLSGATNQNSSVLVALSGTTVQSGTEYDFSISEQHGVTSTGGYAETFTVPISASETAVIVSVAIGGLPNAPTINTQPAQKTVNEGQTATFSVSATTSGGALTYQWQVNTGSGFNNVTLGSGGTTASYTTAATKNAEAANLYIYRCQVTDSNGTTTTQQVYLIVIPKIALAWDKA